MQNIQGPNLFSQCRLCCVGGHHEIDIWDGDAQNTVFTLDAKIFECIGVQVKRDDETTKICLECFGKINGLFDFRLSCTARNINYLVRKIGVSLQRPESVEIDAIDESNIETYEIDSLGENTVQCENSISDQAVPIAYITLTDTESEDETGNIVLPQSKPHDVNIRQRSRRKKKVDGNSGNFPVKCMWYQCLNYFENREAMMLHTQTYHAIGIKKTFECHLCKRILLEKRSLFQHVDVIHCRQKRGIFPKTIRRGGIFVKLNNNMFNEQMNHKFPFKCTQNPCTELFDCRDAMKYHIKIYHVKEIQKTFECYLCGKVVANRQKLLRHMFGEHGFLKRFLCPIPDCGKKFARIDYAKKHFACMHSQPRLMCPIPNCSKQFIDQNLVKEHVLNAHRPHFNYSRTFSCYLCKKTCANHRNLRAHMKTIHIIPKKFKCPIPKCLEKFKQKFLLTKHLAYKHRQGHVHQCDKCKKSFSTKFSLNSHKLLHGVEKRVKCPKPMCTMSFHTTAQLNKHMSSKHGEELPWCPVCRKSFESKRELELHVKRIHGDFFQCPKCVRKFQQKALLKDHLAFTHGQGSTPTCMMCKKTFPSRYSLREHVKRMHTAQ